jgi:nucleoid-associated protein YgaU
VVAGDSLASIAYDEYEDARLWRALAEANHLDDPMRLPPGTELLVPPPAEAAGYR